MRIRPEVTLARLQLAELLHHGDPAAPKRTHLDVALAEPAEMKMQPALGRTPRLNECLGGAACTGRATAP